jgi:hypothetical protein
MIQKFSKKGAGANSCSAMETETIQKNGVSPKNPRRSRRNNFKTQFVCAVLLGILSLTVTTVNAQKITTSTEKSLTGATAVSVQVLNPEVRITPFLCDYEMIPKDKPEAVYEEFNTKIDVKSIASNTKYWVDTYVLVVKAKMMKKYGADAILSATHEVKTSDNGEMVVTVRGYPAKYVNFRLATEKDLWILQFESSKGKEIESGAAKIGIVKQTEVVTK